MITKEELINIVDQFINEKGLFFSFKEFVEAQGYTMEELGFSEE